MNASSPSKLNVGDVVRLTSDTVNMTVRSIDGDKIVCRWHDEADDLLSEDFARAELIFVRSPDRG
jgi:uncharacterized protein YodC (DUF2158 family)